MAARPVAVLLAGQARTLREPQVRQELLKNVVRPTSAALFAHISPQHDYAPWHNYSFVADDGDPEDDLATALRREFDPLPYLRVEPDEQVIRRRQQSNGGSNRWYGAIPWLERPSVLFFRWVLLLEALEVDERRRANRYGVVLRLRPDLVLTCQLPADPLTMLGGYDVVQHGDLALFMRREAASIALSMYQQAHESQPCALKVELCVPGLLVLRNYSVGTMVPGTVALVRPAAFCSNSRKWKAPEWLACGRKYLGQPKPRCRAAPRVWNLSEHVRYWREKRTRPSRR